MCCMGRLVRLVHGLAKGKKVAKRTESYHSNLTLKLPENGKSQLRDYNHTVRRCCFAGCRCLTLEVGSVEVSAPLLAHEACCFAPAPVRHLYP